MKNVYKYLLIVSILFSSCRKDDISEFDPNHGPDHSQVEIESSIYGIVKDKDGLPIVGAKVISEFTEIETNEDGFFMIKKVQLRAEGSLVKVEKNGYFDAFRFAIPLAGSNVRTDIVMLEKKSTTNLSSSVDNKVNLTSQTSVSLKANTIAKLDGTAYNGDFEVFEHFYDPADSEFADQVPGDLRGLNTAGEEVQLASYGMMAMELVSSAGEPLNLIAGSSATWELQVDAAASDLPTDIQLWSLDESNGVWVEESIATLVGGKYIGEVSHFSFWNGVQPFPLVEIDGVVVDENGIPLPNVNLQVKIKEKSTTAYGTTNSQGRFKGKVPKDEELELVLRLSCYENDTYQLGQLTDNTSLGEFTMTIWEGQIQATYSGVFIDCNGMPLDNAYVIVRDGSKVVDVTPVEEDGTFAGGFSACSDGSYVFRGIDLNGILKTEDIIIDYEELGPNMELGEISACAPIEQYLRINIDGEFFVNDAGLEALLLPAQILQLNVENFQRHVELYIGEEVPHEIFLNHPTVGSFGCGYQDSCSDLVVDLTSTPSNAGDIAEGSIKGNIVIDGITRELDIDFRALIDRKVLSVSGHFWFDENENGVKDNDEDYISGFQSGFHRNYERFIFPNDDFEMQLDIPGTYLMTSQNVGDDDSIDSDFDENGYFQMANITEDLVNVDAGFILSGLPFDIDFETVPTYCDDASGCAYISFPFDLDTEYEFEISEASGSVVHRSGLIQGRHAYCELFEGEYEAVIIIDGRRLWTERFAIERTDITLVGGIVSTECVNGTLQADLSVSINNEQDYPIEQSWTDQNGMLVHSGSRFAAESGTYTFTAKYKDCFESLEIVVPEGYPAITGQVWDDSTGSFPGEGETAEPRVEGVKITIRDINTQEEISRITDDNGYYSFESGEISYEMFTVSIEVPDGFSLVEKDKNTVGQFLSSAADPLTGVTDRYSTDNCNEIVLNFGITQ